ncbi:MAG: DNA repair protein RadA [Rickettsiales bacterium]|nr:MAG: DNA repair protein RadA [Rickettsiales bacterium]
MSKVKKQYSCASCGSTSSKWSGQCPDCMEWGTISEEMSSASRIMVPKTGTPQQLQSLSDQVESTIRTKTPIEELNRVLGGGLVSGSAILIGGDPGIGKSTLLLQLSASLSQNNTGCLYITGEESINQIKLRAQRLDIKDTKTGLLAATNVEDIISTIDQNKKELDLVVIDSIQTISTSELSSAPGTVSQIRASAHMLINYAKQNSITLLIACHVNKDGQLAGPKVLEHMVDTVLYFEGDHNNHFRILRSIKNRFGAVNEIGVFEMTAKGLIEIANPSELFLMERENNVSGSAVFAGIEGSRPLLIEIQALIAPSNMATPRRSVVGWDHNRLSMIIAVLSVRFGLNLTSHEVYLSVAGGLRITEPAADLAVAAALISAASNAPLPQGSVFFGEVGLSGEVRKVSQTEARVKEASKLGFKKMYCCSKEKLKSVEAIMHLRQLKDVIV